VTEDPLPLFDLARQWPGLRDEAHEALERVGAAGAFSLGDELARFEAEFAGYCGTRHCIGVANGTAAIELALRAVGAGPGTEVITVAHTFVATVEAIAAAGATPVLVDVDPVTRCIDPEAVRAVLGERTAAVVPVHLYGHLAPIDALQAVCAGRDVAIIEDSAQAHGAQAGGRRAGALATAGAFSFYPTKNLGAMGDAGAVVTDDDAVAATVRSLRHHGSVPSDPNRHELNGGTERLDNLQAALLRLKLRRLDDENEQRRWAARCYRERLADLPVHLPPGDPPDGRSVYHLFVIELADRDAIREALRREGIAAGVHYPTPVHLQPAWRGLGRGEGDLPVTERLARRVLSLPTFPGIQEREIARVCDALRRALAA
jgi:dTDP-3-amino-3,4,6-trideoxy-alpha-D-glucose transaminase